MTKRRMVLLISSSPFAPIPRNIDQFELVCHFNHAPKVPAVSKRKNHVFVRQNAMVLKAQSFRIYPHSNHVQRIIRVGWTSALRAIEPELDSIDLSSIQYDYPHGKSPSTGYAVMMDFLSGGFMPVLSGFDLSLSLGGHKTHDYPFETAQIRRLVKEGKVRRILSKMDIISWVTGLEKRNVRAR